MSTCTKWVNKLVISCKNWSEQIDYECTQWADEGSNQCSDWADEGSKQCSDWGKKCHWYTPWNCVAEWFCKAYYWVAKWVCKAYYWLAKWVCKAFAWVVKAVCVLFSWVLQSVCVAWDTLKCLGLQIIAWLSGKRKAKVKIEHVFVLMLENRSFDHMLGLSQIRGTDAVTGAATVINGVDRNVNSNVNPVDNSPVLVSDPAEYFLKDIDKDPGHEFDNTLTQLCGKKRDGSAYTYPDPGTGGYPPINNAGFVLDYFEKGAASPGRIMKCYNEKQLPVLHALAREFVVCDHWFSSLPGPTFPNRFFMHAASSGGLDDSPSDLDLVVATALDGFRFENGTIFDALDDRCLEWEIFEGDEFPVTFSLSGMDLNALQGRFTDFAEFAEQVNDSGYDKKFIFIEPKYGKHEFDITGPGDFSCGNSMHPVDDVTRGERLIKQTYEVIRNSPHWEKSVLLIVFDEHGGFYDHVAPEKATPPGDLQTASLNHHGFKFDQLGVRVPAIVVSPWTRKNLIDHTRYDHTSLLATLERLMGISPLTERDKAANDFRHLFSLDTPRTDAPTLLPPVADSGFGICEADDEPGADERLIAIRSELVAAKAAGIYQQRAVAEMTVAPSQIGFNYIALRKVLQTASYPVRREWINNFRNIKTGVDAALFMTEAKLTLRHGIDFNEIRLRSAKYTQTVARTKRRR